MNANDHFQVTWTSQRNPELLRAARWVSLATNPIDTRPFIHYVHVLDGNQLVATDGHRLHCAKFPVQFELPEPGVYVWKPTNRNSGTLSRDSRANQDPRAQLPSSAPDLLAHEGPEWTEINFDRGTELGPGELYRLICALGVRDRATGGEVGFNPDYLADALRETRKAVVSTNRVYLESLAEDGPVHFEAIVAGMRL